MSKILIDFKLLQDVMTDYDDLLTSFNTWNNEDDIVWIQYRQDEMRKRLDRLGNVMAEFLVEQPSAMKWAEFLTEQPGTMK